MYAYVGSRTSRERNVRGEGISVFRMDPASGSLDLVQVVGDLINPSFLALNRQGDVLYTVHGDQHEVSAFRVHSDDGTLQFLQRQPCGGKNPVHLALDPSEQFLVVSNHLSSNLAVLPVLAGGELGAVCQTVALTGTPGPHRIEQPFAKPHFNPFDPSGQFVVVPDKGLDRVFTFRFANGRLTPADVPSVATREAAGPRHIAFHPTQPFAYVVNELDSTVTSYRFSAETGGLAPLQILSALPGHYTGSSRASEIAVSPDGRTLYASNRGYDSIAVFRIDAGNGMLRLAEAVPSMGRTPRFFALAPDGRFLFALNEESDSIASFAVEARTGGLTPTCRQWPCGSPVCMVFSALDRPTGPVTPA
ncbi:MAG: putative hemagglutinin-related protein [Polaromonas sp.]|nr:putative hemagglutinin-related protein [Polaromonas sp.]